MNDMERRTFEDAFKNAFQDAEVSPGENVWNSIELDLARVEGAGMKRRVLFFQLMAAASVSFAMCVAGVGYYKYQEQNKNLISLQNTIRAQGQALASEKNASTPESRTAVNPDMSARENNSGDLAASDVREDDGTRAKERANADTYIAQTPQRRNSQTTMTNGVNDVQLRMTEATEANVTKADNAQLVAHRSANDAFNADDKNLTTGRPLPVLYVFKPADPFVGQVKTQEITPDAVAIMLARLNDRENELANEDRKEKFAARENVWTSVGFSAGNFSALNPEVSSSATPALGLAATNKAATSQAKASGTAYSMGISFGTRITDRWVIQGGVNYMTQVSDYRSSVAVSYNDLNYFKAASLNEFREGSDETYVPTAPYTVNNSLRYISVPLQAGYLVIDRQFGVQMNAGVSTDMFLQNTIDPEGSMEKTTEGRGEDSPYRSVNFSGLVGSEISYRFANRYRLSLNPGLRYPFKSIYKDEVGVSSMPLTFDIGLRFRYIFK